MLSNFMVLDRKPSPGPQYVKNRYSIDSTLVPQNLIGSVIRCILFSIKTEIYADAQQHQLRRNVVNIIQNWCWMLAAIQNNWLIIAIGVEKTHHNGL
jgi:hypothetical protein